MSKKFRILNRQSGVNQMGRNLIQTDQSSILLPVNVVKQGSLPIKDFGGQLHLPRLETSRGGEIFGEIGKNDHKENRADQKKKQGQRG